MNRFYLGVHKFTPTAATNIKIDILDVERQRWIEIIRLKNRIARKSPDRLPVKVFKWEESVKVIGWVTNARSILEYSNVSCDVMLYVVLMFWRPAYSVRSIIGGFRHMQNQNFALS